MKGGGEKTVAAIESSFVLIGNSCKQVAIKLQGTRFIKLDFVKNIWIIPFLLNKG